MYSTVLKHFTHENHSTLAIHKIKKRVPKFKTLWLIELCILCVVNVQIKCIVEVKLNISVKVFIKMQNYERKFREKCKISFSYGKMIAFRWFLRLLTYAQITISLRGGMSDKWLFSRFCQNARTNIFISLLGSSKVKICIYMHHKAGIPWENSQTEHPIPHLLHN